jgi:hypothetical protein
VESAPGALVLNRADLTVISPPSSHRHIVKWLMGQRHDETCPRLEPGTSTGKGTSNCMSETKIDFIPQSYPLWVPVAPRKLPWLPPHEGEGRCAGARSANESVALRPDSIRLPE